MSNLIWALVPIVLLAIVYIFIFTRKGEFERAKNMARRHDWLTFFAVIFASVILSSSLRASGVQFPDPPWLMIGLLLFIIVPVIIIVVRRVRTGRPIIQLGSDERIQMIYAKSSRNALFATYLTFVIHHDVTKLNTLDASWMAITVGSGLFMFFASLTFYYFRKSF